MATINVPSIANLLLSLSGSKTYITLGLGAAVVVGNHFGLLPPNLVPANINSANWVTDLFTLALGGTARSALASVAGAVKPS